MNIFNIIAFLAAAIILIANQKIINYAEKKARQDGKLFDSQKAFVITMVAVVILIIKGLFL